jgi:PAN domain
MVVIKPMKKKLLAILILSMSLLVSTALAEPQMSMETNVDRPGMNYNNYPLSSADPQLCANDCANDPNCKAFTYVKPGFRGENSEPECWLKNGVPDPVPNEYCISGVKQSMQEADTQTLQSHAPVTVAAPIFQNSEGANILSEMGQKLEKRPPDWDGYSPPITSYKVEHFFAPTFPPARIICYGEDKREVGVINFANDEGYTPGGSYAWWASSEEDKKDYWTYVIVIFAPYSRFDEVVDELRNGGKARLFYLDMNEAWIVGDNIVINAT